ncbi:MAG: cytochrome b/b6 domain-containing protein [Magnetococcales bacterium]|nr:cytochrome b/b6 domain-containing protein [Magnetococcales bacterium]
MTSTLTNMDLILANRRKWLGVMVGLCLLFINAVSPAWAEVASVDASAHLRTGSVPDNRACLECHDGSRPIEVPDTSPYAQNSAKRLLSAIPLDAYAQGVHARMRCIDCHDRITNPQPPHQIGSAAKIDCAACHKRLAQSLRDSGKESSASPRLKVLLRNIDNHQRSFHARPNKDFPNFPNATCHECHDAHFFNVPEDKSSPAYDNWRLTIPKLCGKCHEEALEDYATSVHGSKLQEKGHPKSANCTDCHTTHEIAGAHLAAFKIVSSDMCGACHQKSLATYRRSYHGQVTQLGYHHTAQCHDCHESHKILSSKDPNSSVHPRHRLKTCQKCHNGQDTPLATAGFATFTPHANTTDRVRHPQMWIAARAMSVLFWSVSIFFLLHSGLWYYREWRECKKGHPSPRIDLSSLGMEQNRHVHRFSPIWRVTHLLFALTVMCLMLTGMTVLNAHSAWAPPVARLLGGAKEMVTIHRIAAMLMAGIFLFHLVDTVQRLLRNRDFAWFGPDSLLPNKKDFVDCRDMFLWFLGRGPKPEFDRWTYFEKFDYWAVFWGMAVIGGSGMVLAFPHIAGKYLEGWVFNVAILIHGQEAFLAIVFLFTVHFFNNHFRFDKLPPPDIGMFTGTQSLEEFQRDHPAQFERLLLSGELSRHLIGAPSNAMRTRSKILGLFLIFVGLVLLFLALDGAIGSPHTNLQSMRERGSKEEATRQYVLGTVRIQRRG